MCVVNAVASTVLVNDQFTGTELNTSVWKRISAGRGEDVEGVSSTVHDGYLDLRMDQTDNGGAVVTRFAPQSHLRIQFTHNMHPGGAYFHPAIYLESAVGVGTANLSWRKSDYGPDYCNNAANFNKVQLLTGWKTDDSWDEMCAKEVYSSALSSSFYDRWSTAVLDYDMTTGLVTVDLENDGTIDMQAVVPEAHRLAATGVGLHGFGWWTGHWQRIDEIKIEGDAVGAPGSYNLTATPESYNQINLDWSPISGAAIYALYRSTSASGPFTRQMYCGNDTSHEDTRSLSGNTTYYYKVVSGDATADCSDRVTGWATPSPVVSSTTDPMPADKISAGLIEMTNTHSSSDHLRIEIDLSVNNSENTGLCSEGKFQIIDRVGKVVTSDEDYECHTVVAPMVLVNFVRYSIQFKIKGVGARSAYFEDGTLQYCLANGTCSDVVGGPYGFSFYGTTFDVGKHAWKFYNGSWGGVKQEAAIWKYEDEIRKNIRANKRSNFLDSVGWTNETADSNGKVSQRSKGLCYGLTNSAIANFSHSDESDSWGKGSTFDTWKDEMEAHWKNEKVTEPYKPFQQKEIGIYPWYPISAKKIMYYHVAQPSYQNETSSNWVGRDDFFKTDNSVYQWANNSELKQLLMGGNPIALGFLIEEGGGHHVAITSAILWNGGLKYMIWDNRFPQNYTWPRDIPVEQRRQVQDYAELHIHDIDAPEDSFSWGSSLIILYDATAEPIYVTNLKSWESARFLGSDEGDSQHIYNTDTIPAAPLSLALAKSAAVPKSPVQAKQAEAIVSTGHIEVLVVGGAVTGVFNKDTGAKINLLSEGELTPGQAVQFIRLGGTMYKLYLPVDGQYRIEASKESSTPLLDIYVNIPNADGTLTSIGYDDQTYLENSVEKVMFYVGRGNSDTNVRRLTKGTTYAPSATETVATAVGAPEYFTGMFTSENRVALIWENPVHPSFSKVQIVRKEDSAPVSPTDGTMVYEGTAQSFTDTGVTVGKYYFYSIYAVDTSAQYSDPQSIGIDTTRGHISGYVKFGDGSGLANATVRVSKTTGEPVNSGITNSQGYYAISNVPFDAYVVSAEHTVNTIQEAPASIVIPETEIVNFTAVPQSLLMINKGGNGSGKVTSAPAGIDCGDDCSATYAVSASVMLTATADPDYRFAGWSGDCSGKLNPLNVTMDTNKSCIASFEKKFPWPMFLPGITRARQ